eukprot:sb/3474685/
MFMYLHGECPYMVGESVVILTKYDPTYSCMAAPDPHLILRWGRGARQTYSMFRDRSKNTTHCLDSLVSKLPLPCQRKEGLIRIQHDTPHSSTFTFPNPSTQSPYRAERETAVLRKKAVLSKYQCVSTVDAPHEL